jgi:hypothetical protein
VHTWNAGRKALMKNSKSRATAATLSQRRTLTGPALICPARASPHQMAVASAVRA